jgi:hypothetical protein
MTHAPNKISIDAIQGQKYKIKHEFRSLYSTLKE